MAGRLFPSELLFPFFSCAFPIPDPESLWVTGRLGKEQHQVGPCSDFWEQHAGAREEHGTGTPPERLCTRHYRGATVICFHPKNNTFNSGKFPHLVSGDSLHDCQALAQARRVRSRPSPVLLANKDCVTVLFIFLTTPTTALQL